MNSKFMKQTINPIEFIKNNNEEVPSFIEYDPKIKTKSFDIVRQQSHDGTLLFQWQLIADILNPIVGMTACIKSNQPDIERLKYIKYIIGNIKIATVFGEVWLPASKTHKYNGQRDRGRMSVICEYVY